METSARKKIVFLCSGGGGNLRFVHQAIERGWVHGLEIAAVLCDRICTARDFAAACGIASEIVDLTDENQANLARTLRQFAPDIIVTTVHKVLLPAIVDVHRGKLVNLHYSLLPAFGGIIGMRPVKAALTFGARFTGVTAHHVDESVDGGRPIVQATIPLRADEAFSDDLANVVFRCGCLTLLAAIDVVALGGPSVMSTRMSLSDRSCQFEGGPIVTDPAINAESFWSGIAQTPPATQAC